MPRSHPSPGWRSLSAKTYGRAPLLLAGAAVGVSAFLYAKAITLCQQLFIGAFHQHPYACLAWTPLFFLLATALVVKLSPEASGSGIPQVMKAIRAAGPRGLSPAPSRWVALSTAAVKTLSTTLGILGGASIGREGPTVQISSSIFSWVAHKTRRSWGEVDFKSYLIAGAAAGVSAAFNTPLAGITFALEEIASSLFGRFKTAVVLSVVVAGITAQALGGNYLYFGHPSLGEPTWLILPAALGLGVGGGLAGGCFARLLSRPGFGLVFFKKRWWLRALACGLVCGGMVFLSKGDTSGSGYEVTRRFMDDPQGELPLWFFPAKFFATVFSYQSGMAGGIFSPCLSVGAGMGFALAKLAHLANLKTCALLGMAAFFAGVVQAPLTSVIIVMEMTDQHSVIIPLIVAAFLAQGVARLIMPVPLYQFLAFGRKDP